MESLNKEEIQIIRDGESQLFWQIIRDKVIKPRFDYLQKLILEDDTLIDTISITRRDLIRKEWQTMKWFLDLPKNIGEKGIEFPSETKNYDPYE